MDEAATCERGALESRGIDPMICRIWHGWTTPANAEGYERLLRAEVFRAIAARAISGYCGIELLRRPAENAVEFVTRSAHYEVRQPH